MAKIKEIEGSCISSVSVLQNMTLNAESRQFIEKNGFFGKFIWTKVAAEYCYCMISRVFGLK